MYDDQESNRGPRRFVECDAATITDPVALSIGIYAYTGQGKTMSARLLARGISAVTGRRVVFVDCDNGRGLHFRKLFPEQRYVDFQAPHNALDYVALLEQYERENVVLVIDNMTAEHDGEGGLLDTFEHAKKGKESRNAVAWGVAKTQHKKLVRTFVRVNRTTPIIVTWRAQEKIDWTKKDDQGKTAPESEGEMPIGSRDLPFEMTATYLLPAGSKGAPCLDPKEKGERLMTKIPGWFEDVIKRGEKFHERHGEAFARWAFGAPKPTTQAPSMSAEDVATAEGFRDRFARAAEIGLDAVQEVARDVGKLRKGHPVRIAVNPDYLRAKARAEGAGDEPPPATSSSPSMGASS